jgi:malate synthase
MSSTSTPSVTRAGSEAASVGVRGPPVDRSEEILTRDALGFLADLHRSFEARRQEALRLRGEFRDHLRRGGQPGFPEETLRVRDSEWRVPPPPADLEDRRVEITGPVDRKMIINALNSGARVYMADFEDAHSPTWTATLAGQVNLVDAVRREITFTSPEGKEYQLTKNLATLMVRPRGWHLNERHLTVDGASISASLFDFGLFLFHNARALQERSTGPYFYVPKMEHYREARLWNDVFVFAEKYLGLRSGTIRATALIETLPAVFQMDEILSELREHSVGLNCGRWDYLFSFIKQYRDDPNARFPDRSLLTMDRPFLSAYSRLLIETCHRRRAHAMGGMAAQIPIKGDPAANEAALAKVVADKEREVRAGHDGTWVAHPALVPIALAVFDREMPQPNQINSSRPPSSIGAAQLLAMPTGPITTDGVRRNTRVAFLYLSSWLEGSGCVPIDHLMEDAATAEIARSQLWQWIHHGARTEEGTPVDAAMFRAFLEAEVRPKLSDTTAESGPPTRAAKLLDSVVTGPELAEFITEQAYSDLADTPGGRSE